MKKYLPESIHKTFRDIANEHNVNIFKKTIKNKKVLTDEQIEKVLLNYDHYEA